LQFLETAGFVERTASSAGQGVTYRGTATTAIAIDAFDLARSPDSGPAMAVLAASNPTGIRFDHAGRLRYKESDRVEGMARLAAACGGAMSISGDSVWIRAVGPAPPTTAFDPVFDHRLAMAAGVAALRWPGIQVTDPAVVAKSFPDFWTQLDLLR
jgi:3-phosphoshikimate 1-carboxyvinyltransferase